MSPEEQRIAIAESVGWRFHLIEKYLVGKSYEVINPEGRSRTLWSRHFRSGPMAEHETINVPFETIPHICEHGGVPDYLNDLNAMHEVEMSLNFFQKEKFRSYLSNFFFEIGDGRAMTHSKAIHATAAQRAEAYLRTIGKWRS